MLHEEEKEVPRSGRPSKTAKAAAGAPAEAKTPSRPPSRPGTGETRPGSASALASADTQAVAGGGSPTPRSATTAQAKENDGAAAASSGAKPEDKKDAMAAKKEAMGKSPASKRPTAKEIGMKRQTCEERMILNWSLIPAEEKARQAAAEAAARAAAAPPLVPVVLSVAFNANDLTEEEKAKRGDCFDFVSCMLRVCKSDLGSVFLSMLCVNTAKRRPTTKPEGKKGGAAAVEPDQATLSFVVPPAVQFGGDLGEGGINASQRAVSVYLAINGQQFVEVNSLACVRSC